MKRTAIPPAFNPIDAGPIPPPKLTFSVQKANASFATGGLFSRGSIKFDADNVQMIDLATTAFIENSAYKDETAALQCFLSCLSVTSSFEGGFDAVNTYDIAGISVGFLQFARPEGGVGRLLELVGEDDLAATVKSRFGTKDPHATVSAKKARFDEELLKQVVIAVASPQGIKAQFAMAVNKNVDGQCYFDQAYKKYLELKLTDPLSCNLLFDSAVNMGVGSLSRFKPCADGNDGDWIAESIAILKRPERKKGWRSILSSNFA